MGPEKSRGHVVCLQSSVMEVDLKSVNNDEFDGVSCTLDAFTHNDDVLRLIGDLPNVYDNARSMEIALEKLTVILNKYQEQPHLLDPYLNNHLEKLVNIVRDKEFNMMLKDNAFKFIRLIINVRGYKVVVRHLPHEVADLEPVLTMLEGLNAGQQEHWETSYVLLFWMSIIVKIPFDMSRLDGGKNTITQRILAVCFTFLRSSTTVGAAAAYLTACFLTRSDAVQQCLTEFLEWSFASIKPKDERTAEEDRNFLAALTAIAAILKHGKRNDLLPHATNVLEKILESNYKTSKNSLLRKYGVKVIQRIGLTFLKPKVASWRYQRGSRSLAENLKMGSCSAVLQNALIDDDEDIEVPEEMEEIIEELMQSLKDPETVIRWSAAKGIGRVTGRLPQDLANDVITTMVDLLNNRESDSTWHGVCLALAELGRRGLLLPLHLPQVLPLIRKALVYEDSRGYYSIGEHVRDAACYVAWSFARAYDPEILRPHVQSLASGLLIVTLFDREVKCRKAAAAAFQEHVGRQGTFPHGIDIVTAADYFTVAVRHNAYLNISVFVAAFPEYTEPLISHLVDRKVGHWDLAVRELTASALHVLTPLAADLAANQIIPELLVQTKSSDLNSRHGAVLAVGQVIHALSKLNRKLDDDAVNELLGLISHYQAKFYLNGMGGEILRQAFCQLIEKCAESVVAIKDASILDAWQQLLNECVLSEVSIIRQRAAAALTPFLRTYRSTISATDRDDLVDIYLRGLASSNQTTRIGLAAALSALPPFLLLPRLADIVAGLLDALRITELTAKWAEARRDCVTALVHIVTQSGVAALCDPRQEWDASVATNVGTKTRLLPEMEMESGSELLLATLEAFLLCLAEYTQDARGDIGAWVREAAMTGFGKLVIAIARWQEEFLSKEILARIIGGIAQQAVERIDRTRFLAGKVFSDLLHNVDPVLKNIPHRENLLEIFPRNESLKDIVWSNEAQTFPRFVQLLRFPCYTRPVMEGLVLSIGGLTERLVKHSSASLFSYLKSQTNIEERVRVCDSILSVFSDHLYDTRVIIPLFSFLDSLLGSSVVRDVLDAEDARFPLELLRLAKLEVSKSKDFKKLVSNMDVFCQLVQVNGDISRRALCQMTVFLCNRLKAVRKTAATKLYECLLIYGDVSSVPDDNLDEAMTLLSETEWEQDVSQVRPIRNKLCKLLDIPVPTIMTRPD